MRKSTFTVPPDAFQSSSWVFASRCRFEELSALLLELAAAVDVFTLVLSICHPDACLTVECPLANHLSLSWLG